MRLLTVRAHLPWGTNCFTSGEVQHCACRRDDRENLCAQVLRRLSDDVIGFARVCLSAVFQGKPPPQANSQIRKAK